MRILLLLACLVPSLCWAKPPKTPDLSAYDRVSRGAADLADSLALGIVEQYPDRFAR